MVFKLTSILVSSISFCIIICTLSKLSENNILFKKRRKYGQEVIWDYSDIIRQEKIAALDGSEDDYYGHSIAVCNDLVVIGAHSDKFRGIKSGSAYVYKVTDRKNWDMQSKLFPDITADSDYFGWSVACDRNLTVVGAYGSDIKGNEAGAVFIFSQDDREKWSQMDMLVAYDGAPGDYFGWSVAVHHDVIIVGAIGHDWSGMDSGLVYAYSRTQLGSDTFQEDAISSARLWALEAVIHPADASPYAYFGWSVDIYKSTVVVGAPWKDLRQGAAYVFTRNESIHTTYADDDYYTYAETSYRQVAHLLPAERNVRDFFGSSIALHEDVVVVGAHLALTGDIHGGAVFVFRHDGSSWQLVQKLTSAVFETQITYYGYSVDVYEGVIFVGAPGSTDSLNASVHIYSENFRSDGWDLTVVLHSPEDTVRIGSAFGVSVSLSEGLAAIGSERGTGLLHQETSGCAYLIFPTGLRRSIIYRILSSVGIAGLVLLGLVAVTASYVFCYRWKTNKRRLNVLSTNDVPYDGLNVSDDGSLTTSAHSMLTRLPATSSRGSSTRGLLSGFSGHSDGSALSSNHSKHSSTSTSTTPNDNKTTVKTKSKKNYSDQSKGSNSSDAVTVGPSSANANTNANRTKPSSSSSSPFVTDISAIEISGTPTSVSNSVASWFMSDNLYSTPAADDIIDDALGVELSRERERFRTLSEMSRAALPTPDRNSRRDIESFNAKQ